MLRGVQMAGREFIPDTFAGEINTGIILTIHSPAAHTPHVTL